MEDIIQEALSKGVEMCVSGEFDLASKSYESVLKQGIFEPWNDSDSASGNPCLRAVIINKSCQKL